jgi:hypothetical protein
MPRIAIGARQTPVKTQTVVTALLISAALALSACDTVGPGSLGSDDEASEEFSERAAQPAPGGQESASTSGGEAGGEPGQVIEIISPEPEATGQSAAPAEPQNSSRSQTETLAALPQDPAINDDPQQLIGMGPASLNAFLGAPELIRREAPASLWQYRADGCVLDVVLYPDRSGDKVTYLEAREDGATKMPPRTCLNKLLRARYDGSAG